MNGYCRAVAPVEKKRVPARTRLKVGLDFPDGVDIQNPLGEVNGFTVTAHTIPDVCPKEPT
jgi:hypothetical protein